MLHGATQVLQCCPLPPVLFFFLGCYKYPSLHWADESRPQFPGYMDKADLFITVSDRQVPQTRVLEN